MWHLASYWHVSHFLNVINGHEWLIQLWLPAPLHICIYGILNLICQCPFYLQKAPEKTQELPQLQPAPIVKYTDANVTDVWLSTAIKEVASKSSFYTTNVFKLNILWINKVKKGSVIRNHMPTLCVGTFVEIHVNIGCDEFHRDNRFIQVQKENPHAWKYWGKKAEPGVWDTCDAI